MTHRPKNSLILAEQTRLSFDSLPLGLAAATFNACVLAYILRHVVDEFVLIVWLLFVVFTMLLRGLFLIGYRLQKPWDSSSENWHRWNTIGVVISSIAWGSSNIVIFPESSVVHQAFLAFVIAGLSAGAVSTLAHSRSAALIFLTALLPLLSVRFFMEETELNYAMGTMIALYYVVLVGVVLNLYKNSRQNIELRIDSEIQKKELKESEEKYYRIFESSPLGIIHYKKDGTVVSCNDMLCELLGMSSEQVKKINLLSVKGDMLFTEAVGFSLKGNAAQYEGTTEVISFEKNRPIRVYFRDIRDLDGRISGGVAIVEDKTEDKLVDKLKSEFVSTVSHELRTPLTAITGSIRLIKNAQKLSEEQCNSLFDNIDRNSARLLSLVNDIMDLEKVSIGEMDFNFENVPIFELLQQSVADNQPYAASFNVLYKITETSSQYKNIEVRLDQQRFLQVMANILSNAAKFSPSDSDVMVDLTEQDGGVKISVSDKGKGIALKFKDKIFEKFTQEDATDTKNTGGTGLGLAISKEIVERMNGTIGFESQLNHGSIFYVNFPVINHKEQSV